MAAVDPVRVLVFGDNAFPYHRIEEIGPLFTAILRDTTEIDASISSDPAALHDLPAGDYDVLLDYSTEHTRLQEVRPQLLEYVDRGGGFVGLHGATVLHLDEDPAQRARQELIGGRFLGHPDLTDLTITLEDDDHPITGSLSDFSITDEPYELEVDGAVRVLASTTHEAFGRMPVAWTTTYGTGRVFYYANGHDARAFCTPGFQRLLTRGIRWAAGQL